jgi:hypothetical protein
VILGVLILVSSFVIIESPNVQYYDEVEETGELERAIAQTSNVHRMVIVSGEDESVSSANPDTNYHDDKYRGGLFVGRNINSSYYSGRSWLMFNLSHLPEELDYINATLNVYCNGSITDADRPISAHFSNDDSWREDTITWSNQPSFDFTPEDVIDQPVSPDMFIDNQWYSWDVTEVFDDALEGDEVLSIVLKQENEGIMETTWKYFTEKDHHEVFAPYLTVYYDTPITTDLTVDGFDSPPDTDLIYSEHPGFGWQFNDPLDSQRSYEIDLMGSDNEVSWSKSFGSMDEVFTAGAEEVSPPFAQGNGLRMQMEWSHSLIHESGIVDKFYLGTSAPDGTTITLNNFMVLMDNKITSGFDDVFKDNYKSDIPICVLFREHLDLAANGGYFEIDVENTFAISNTHRLLLEMRYSSQTGASVSCLAETDEGSGICAYTTGAEGTGAEESKTASIVVDRTCNLKLKLLSKTVEDMGGTGSQYPFDYDSARIQMTYNNSHVGRAGKIDRLYFETSYTASFRPHMSFENFTVRIGEPSHLGPLDPTFQFNSMGSNLREVLFRDSITILNDDYWFEIVLDTPYDYQNTGHLLIELLWDARTSPHYLPPVFQITGPGYQAVADNSSAEIADSTSQVTYSLALGFLDSENKFTPNSVLPSDNYTLLVRTCDGLGIWSPWIALDFTYFLPGDGPRWTNPVYSSNPTEVNQEFTVEINATGALGVSAAQIEYDGMNHSMASAGITYSYAWTPQVLGILQYTIFLQDGVGYWSSASGSVMVHDTVSPSILTSPSDITFVQGSLGNRLEWSVSEHLPSTYFIYIDNVLERSGPWDGSVIGMTVDLLGVGSHNVTLRVVDTSGNENTDTAIVNVSEATTTTSSGTGGLNLTNLLLVAVGGLGIINLILLIIMRKAKPKE